MTRDELEQTNFDMIDRSWWAEERNVSGHSDTYIYNIKPALTFATPLIEVVIIPAEDYRAALAEHAAEVAGLREELGDLRTSRKVLAEEISISRDLYRHYEECPITDESGKCNCHQEDLADFFSSYDIDIEHEDERISNMLKEHGGGIQ